MIYDFEYYRPSTYYTPRYYTSYSPSYFVGDNYYNAYRYRTPLYRYASTYASTRAYLPYRPNYDYTYSIPDYSYSTNRYYTTTPISRMLSPIYPEAVRYDYTYGADFDSATQSIRSSASKLLSDIRQTVPRAASVPRYVRGSSLEPIFNSDFDYNYGAKRALSRARLMSEEPSYYRSIKYF